MEDLFQHQLLTYEEKVRIAERFLDRYEPRHAGDIYRWIWEGEFGMGTLTPEHGLEELSQDIRGARMHARRSGRPFWSLCEDAGLSRRYLKINLVLYADSGCPLQRLNHLAERMKDARPDPLRFKRDWAFIKTQIVPGMTLDIDAMNSFENDIAFHMAPETDWSEDFVQRFGVGYRIVPRSLFFQYFPEYSEELGRE